MRSRIHEVWDLSPSDPVGLLRHVKSKFWEADHDGSGSLPRDKFEETICLILDAVTVKPTDPLSGQVHVSDKVRAASCRPHRTGTNDDAAAVHAIVAGVARSCGPD
jgi:hypothetical protein